MSGKFFQIAGWCGGMGLVFLLLTSFCLGGQGVEGMDTGTLITEAVQLQKQLDQDPGNYKTMQSLGIVYHYLAVRDSKTYVFKAFEILEKASRINPEDNLVLCCLGNVYSLMAKDAGNPLTRMDYLTKGIERMDKAVRKEPDHILIRMIRANNAKSLPRFLNRRTIAFEDLEYLVGLIDKGHSFPLELKVSIYGQLAVLYQEDGNTIKAKKYHNLSHTLKQEN